MPPQSGRLPGGRLHLQHGPIDLVIGVSAAPDAARDACDAAERRFATVLEELCDELPLLRQPIGPYRIGAGSPAEGRGMAGVVARRMTAAVRPYAAQFITPMAAVAGAVADEIIATMTAAAPLHRAFVNNGGDIAIHLAPGESLRVGLVDRPDQPGLFAAATVSAGEGVAGIATSGWRGRSFSLGIADAVTVLAATAAEADAAATIIANAVDLPGHPAITRVPARDLQPDSDLGLRRVTRAVAPLWPDEIAAALAAGQSTAERLQRAGLITTAALHCHGVTRIVQREAIHA